MMKLKKGQKVYYFKETGPFMGDIIPATVVGASKDIYSRKVLYTVVPLPYPKKNVFTFWNKENETVYEDQLYINLKKIQHEYKEYLAYGALVSGIGDVKEALDKLHAEIELIKKKIKKPTKKKKVVVKAEKQNTEENVFNTSSTIIK